MNSLLDKEYETFVLTLINCRQSLNYNDVSAALVNYKVRRKDKQSSSNGASAEALMVRGKGSNRKGKGERERSMSKPSFKDLKKGQCAFCKEIEHWKVDCPRIKDKNKGKESKTGANLVQVITTQASTSQADGSDSGPSVFSFSVTTPTLVTQVILSWY